MTLPDTARVRRGIAGTARTAAWRGLATVDHYLDFSAVVTDSANRVLMYHSVGGGFYDDIEPDRFRQQLAALSREYEFVDLPKVLTDTSEKRIALTFDDGTRDFYEHVRPTLHEFGAPATVFVIADAIDGSFVHDDVADYEYMSADQLRALADDDLITVGNHTRTHPKLDQVPSTDELWREIAGGKQALERVLGAPVDRFCYPYGRYSPAALDIVRETHELATRVGGRDYRVTGRTDPHLIPRVNAAADWRRFRWEVSDISGRVANALYGT